MWKILNQLLTYMNHGLPRIDTASVLSSAPLIFWRDAAARAGPDNISSRTAYDKLRTRYLWGPAVITLHYLFWCHLIGVKTGGIERLNSWPAPRCLIVIINRGDESGGPLCQVPRGLNLRDLLRDGLLISYLISNVPVLSGCWNFAYV